MWRRYNTPDVHLLSPETIATSVKQHFNDYFRSILATNQEIQIQYNKLDGRRQNVLLYLLLYDNIETWHDAREKAMVKAQEIESQMGMPTAGYKRGINY